MSNTGRGVRVLQTFKAMSDHLDTLGHTVAANTIRNWQYRYGYKPKRRGRTCFDTVDDFMAFFKTVILAS